jgi:hypothetical protein
MERTVLSEAFSQDNYNSLPCVEDADKGVTQHGALAGFLDQASRTFHKHAMQDRFGVALLHKHFECANGEHMIQYNEIVDGERALVMRPVRTVPAREDAVPIVWSLSAEQYRPLEYSTDSLARELYGAGSVPQPFLDEFSDLLRFSPIGRHIGLAVVNRELYADASDSLTPVEFSRIDRSSVLFMRNRAEYKNHIIQTAWNFSTPDGGAGCEQTPGGACFINASGYHIQDPPPHHKPI